MYEVEQKMTEKAWTHHPETGEPVKRIIQAVGIVFKGSGFYKTDSRPNAKSSEKSSGAGPQSEQNKNIETKTSENKITESKITEPKNTDSSSKKPEPTPSSPKPSSEKSS